MNFHINKRTDSGEMFHVPLERDWFMQSSKPGFQLVHNETNKESSRTYLVPGLFEINNSLGVWCIYNAFHEQKRRYYRVYNLKYDLAKFKTTFL